MTVSRLFLTLALFFSLGWPAASADPLPCWNQGDCKQRIVGFVESVTDPASAGYVTPGGTDCRIRQ